MLKDAVRTCRLALEQGGIADAAFEAVCIARHVTGFDRTQQLMHADEPLSDRQRGQMLEITQKRLTRYPLQYLLNSWDFMGLELSVGEGVLIPRDDTEVCARLCLQFLRDIPNARVIDLCAGSGAIAIALAKLTGAEVIAVEKSESAFKFLLENINNHQVTVTAIHDDIFSCYDKFDDGVFDLIVSNPPYIPSHEIEGLQAEVQHEPRMALDGGTDGCDFYRAIISHWSGKLKSGGALVLELGEGQAEEISALMTARGFENVSTEPDFGGTQRAIIGTMK